jgi:hypothetical protein
MNESENMLGKGCWGVMVKAWVGWNKIEKRKGEKIKCGWNQEKRP